MRSTAAMRLSLSFSIASGIQLLPRCFLLFRSNYYNEIYVDVSYPIIAIGGSNLYCLACLGFAADVSIMEIAC